MGIDFRDVILMELMAAAARSGQHEAMVLDGAIVDNAVEFRRVEYLTHNGKEVGVVVCGASGSDDEGDEGDENGKTE